MILRLAILFFVFHHLGGVSMGQIPVWTHAIDSISMFSSPQFVELTGDGILDVVVGGGLEGSWKNESVVALDGVNGNLLWQVGARDQVYGTALFKDISGDGVDDVFISGRSAVLYALDGTSGSFLWEFWPDSLGPGGPAGWFNFYNPQWIPDANQDGIDDLLISNGGKFGALAFDSMRPPGHLAIIDALTGDLIVRAVMPDSHETYCSPVLLDRGDGAGDQVLFGTGGETVRGKFWSVDLDSVLAGDLSSSVILLNDTLKGFIPPPSLADLNGDQVYDPIIPGMNGSLTALSGSDNTLLWRQDFPGYENYVSPTIGQFTGDATPDVFGMLAKGQWGFYAEFLRYCIDGATGQVVWQDTASTYQFTQANALDLDGDGFDEILTVYNYDAGWTTIDYKNQFQILDFQTGQVNSWGFIRSGINFFSTPGIADIDGNGDLDIVFVTSINPSVWAGANGARIQRIGLGVQASQVAWAGYLGTERDGYYRPGLLVETQEPQEIKQRPLLFPNPVKGELHIRADRLESIRIFDQTGRLLLTKEGESSMDVSMLPAGLYTVEIKAAGIGTFNQLIKL